MTRVLVDVVDHVAHVRLNRPEKRNGLDLEMFHAIVAAARQVRLDKSVRAVVLSGEGKAFCAGLDWMAFMQGGAETGEALLQNEGAIANLAQQVGWAWTECEVPVIAALHGPVFGGGLQIALGADIRLAAPDTKLSVMEVRYGLVPDMGASQTLLRVVRSDVAKELTFTARIVGAEEAQRLGLVTRVEADPLAAALALAREIAGNSPHAVRAAKQLLDGARNMTPEASFKQEAALQRTLLGTHNQMAAVQAVMSKQDAEFEDP